MLKSRDRKESLTSMASSGVIFAVPCGALLNRPAGVVQFPRTRQECWPPLLSSLTEGHPTHDNH
jgi:hypothetical protein